MFPPTDDDALAELAKNINHFRCLACEDQFTVMRCDSDAQYYLSCGCKKLVPIQSPSDFPNAFAYCRYVTGLLKPVLFPNE